ncbi:MAG TPA: flagellar biosynthesis protein FlhB [Chthonomonadaceae bacterium]|nr:flagellar biosynthesis protein FlhB [Chthonomonadaceae bacterium]
MAGEDRTETATPRRRSEARKKGQVAKSSDLSSIVVLLGLLIALHSLGGGISLGIKNYVEGSFNHLDDTRISIALVMQHGAVMFLVLIRAVGPLAAIAILLGLIVNMAQTGPIWSTTALQPDFNRLNPLTGAQRFVSSAALVNLAKSLYKIGIIGYIAYVTLRSSYPQLLLMTRLDVPQALGLVGDVAYRMALRITVAMLVLAALDYFYQRYAFEKSLRMTKDEVKQEFKSVEGNPQIKQRIRARQRQMARKRMMSEVPSADVVVTNPTHFAVALKYEAEKMTAPVVVAKGQDRLALKIRELAQQNDVPIMENPPLARALYKQCDLGREIPADLYAAVAEVLAFVYQINQRRRERMGLSVSTQ